MSGSVFPVGAVNPCNHHDINELNIHTQLAFRARVVVYFNVLRSSSPAPSEIPVNTDIKYVTLDVIQVRLLRRYYTISEYRCRALILIDWQQAK